jgi:large subunit ribosomal protein L18
MARKSKKRKVLKFKRRRDSLTNYKKRLALIKSSLDRVVVRKSNKGIIAQIVSYDAKGDKVTLSVDSRMLKKYNWQSRCNRPTAYLTGALLAKKARDANYNGELVLDIGLSSSVSSSIPFIFAKGCADGGLKIKGSFDYDEKIYMPGRIAEYAKKRRESGDNVSFSMYVNESSMEKIDDLFNKVKNEINK